MSQNLKTQKVPSGVQPFPTNQSPLYCTYCQAIDLASFASSGHSIKQT